MATISEVSKLAGVSVATVSRVINDSGRVREATRQKVLAAIEALDYRPNSIAQSLASKRSNSVGILVPELHGPFFGTLLSGVEAELRNSGKHAVITVGHNTSAEETDGIEFLRRRRCDALMIIADAVDDDYLADVCAGPTPVVIMTRLVPEAPQNCISLDNELGGYIATRHVLDLGHRRVAYVSGPLSKRDARDRLAGHTRALKSAGLEVDGRLVVEGNYQADSGSDGLRLLLERGIAFSVVVCANDSMAAGVMVTAREQGLHVPGEISVMGFDNISFSRYLHPKLSTVNYPVVAMGRMGARWILKRVYGRDDLKIEHLFEPKLVPRESVQRRGVRK